MGHKDRLECAPRSFQHLLVHRIKRILRTEDFVLRFDRMVGNPKTHARHGVDANTAGTMDDEHEDKGSITVDHRCHIISSVVHECLHIIYQDASEEQVIALTRFVMNDMHPAQAKRLLLLMAECIVKKTPTD